MSYPGKLRYLGVLGRPWGHRGELAFSLAQAEVEELAGMRAVFVELQGLPVPFFVEGVREHPKVGATLKLKGLDDPQAVAFLVNAEVFAPAENGDGEGDEEDLMEPADFVGMQVLDEEHGPLGEVTGIEGTDDHPVLAVSNGATEILVPFVEEMIVGIDEASGNLVVRTPPGLVDLYRGG